MTQPSLPSPRPASCRRRSRPVGRAAQRGVTLVIGLIMLLVLTVLAVSSMRTASLELVMAGNAQARENAFQLAQAGLDGRLAGYLRDRTALDVAAPCPAPADPPLPFDPPVAIDALRGQFATRLCYAGDGSDLITGSSIGKLDQGHYELTADASSTERGARSVLVQGFYVLQPAVPE